MLTTPDILQQREFDRVQETCRRWLLDPSPQPLVIGGCIVQFAHVPPLDFEVVQA